MTKKTLFTAATMGLLMGACASNKTASSTSGTPATGEAASAASDGTGECWGINSCKGKGACGGKGHSCSGQNSCRGKGWLKTTKAECIKKKGKFKDS